MYYGLGSQTETSVIENMKTFQGKQFNINKTIIGRITKGKKPFFIRRNFILLTENLPYKGIIGYNAIISTDKASTKKQIKKSMITEIKNNIFPDLNEGDIVLLNSKGEVVVLWDVFSNQNCLLITEECNCRCLMCPQPPKKDPPDRHLLNKKILKLLDQKSVSDICITGGEPTLKSNNFFRILKICKDNFPDANITILTNAKKFSDFNFTKQLASLRIRKLLICISLHADINDIHDKITVSKGSFFKVIKGIYNLAKCRIRIEIRCVINKFNYERMQSFSIFVYRNFPFVVHVAFLGLEISGFAEENFDKVWINPYVYKNELKEAVLNLNRRAINVSIYNIPHCLLSQSIWSFARQSISTWKNVFLPICEQCQKKNVCCGVFLTSSHHSNDISPIK